MATGGSKDSGFLKIIGKTPSKNLKKKSMIDSGIVLSTDVKATKIKDKDLNENKTLQQEVKQTIEMIRNLNMESDDRKTLTEKTLELLSVQSNEIERLEKELQELKARIKRLQKSEQELKKQLTNAHKGDKNGSEYDQQDIGKLRKQIDKLNDTIAEKDKEVQKAKETKLHLSVEFEKLTKNFAEQTKKQEENIAGLKNDITKKHEEDMEGMKNDITKKHEEDMEGMKNDITKKHEEDMADMKTELTKQNEKVIEHFKRLESVLRSGMAEQQSKKKQAQDPGKSSQHNKPKSKSSVQNRPSKSGLQPTWKSTFKKSD